MPAPTRSREWFQQQIAALGALLRRLPPRRQATLLEALADETPDQKAATKPTKDTPDSREVPRARPCD